MYNSRRIYILIIAIFISFFIMMLVNSASEVSDLKTFIREREMPALGIAAYSKLNNTAAFYKRAGEKLLGEDYIQNWILDGEQDVEAVIGFMEGVRVLYGLLDASLVSDLSETYYGTDGRVVELSSDNVDRDGWYYHYREAVGESNIDSWYYPETGIVGLYVNIPIRSRDGRYLGVTGGGIDSTVFDKQLKTLESDWDLSIYMVRNDGQLIYATESSFLNIPVETVDDVWGVPVLDRMSREKQNTDGLVIVPDGRSGPVLWAGYMPEWETYLILEKNSEVMAAMVRGAIYKSLMPGGLLTALLLILMMLILRFVTAKANRSVLTGQGYVHRFQSVVYIQNGLLESTEDRLMGCGEEAAGRELKLKRESLKLLLSSDSRQYGKTQVNLNELIHDIMLEKSSALSRRKIHLHSRLSATNFIVAGNESLFSFILSELLDKAAQASADESEIVLLTGDRQRTLSVDIAFQARADLDGDFDVSILLPVMEALDVSLKVEASGLDSYIFQLEYQISGE